MAPNILPKTPALLQSSPPKRESSTELGSPSKITQYHKSTGRPIRKSAGKVKKVAGYVDSGILEDEDFMEESSSSLSSEESEVDMDDRGRPDKAKLLKSTKQRKRKRSPSPPSPRLEPIIYAQELEELTDDETSGAFHHHTPRKPPITLQFNVPLGFHGPLFVKLDSALLNDEAGKRHDMHTFRSKKARTASPERGVGAAVVQRKGFTDLPPELRNAVYRHMFVRKGGEKLSIPQGVNGRGLAQSSQFLRTCKLVHDEGCSVLYGENEFQFSRHFNTRSPFWEPKPKEIGYQDFLHFLKMIGPENVQYLRDIQMEFDDALPKHTSDLNVETRRYIVDEYLLNCLRILRDAKLRKVTMMFFGRRQLMKSDIKFLGYLEQVKADEVVKKEAHWAHHGKLSNWMWNDLKEQMTRKKKLYEKK
jgi:hypothetical protein